MKTSIHWHMDNIDDELAADFDGSLSGLGIELGTSSFNMSEALMALPTLKNEHRHHHHHHSGNDHDSHNSSPHASSTLKDSEISSLSLSANHSNQDDRPVAVVHGKKSRLAYGQDEESVSSAIKRFCFSNDREASNSEPVRLIFATHGLLQRGSDDCNHEECTNEIKCQQRHSSSAPDLRTTSGASSLVHSGSCSPSPGISSTSILTQILSLPHHNSFSYSTQEPKSPVTPNSNEFQYILSAATSMATKVNEETMTYLNQGQSYEIKVKRLDVSEGKKKLLRSIIRIGFHERRLQYMEKELINQWKQSRQLERILEIDAPLSYGILGYIQNSHEINRCEFVWDPTKETGVFVKVNCISTEFTPKKHGGEKGVPFRLIIETHIHGSSKSSCLNAASCQIKVFKPKGADRKHKTDREKMCKRPQSEQAKYQPSYEYTALTDYPLDAIYWTSSPQGQRSPSSSSPILCQGSAESDKKSPIEANQISNEIKRVPSIGDEKEEDINNLTSPVHSILSSDANSEETARWLAHNRFDEYARTFSNFSGSDLLKMSKSDLIQICGLSDGIRLFNALHIRSVRPKLTLYVCNPSDEVFRAIYLENLTVNELKHKLSETMNERKELHNISRICLQGPSEIKVLMADDVIRNFNDESIFMVEFEKDANDNTFEANLKPYR